ncbi:MAG: hypothetical protein OHK0046_19120 [Anaerolineae bacterium]
MGIHVSWDEEDIIWLDFVGKWTWLDYRYASDDIIKMVKTVRHRVYIIADMRRAAPAPKDSDNQTVRDSLEMAPANHGLVIFLGADRFTQMIIGIMQKFIPIVHRKIKMAQTLEEAQAIVFQERDRHGWPQAAAGDR